MSESVNRETGILGNGIIQDCQTGQVEVFSDTSGVAIFSASGDICFDDQHTSGFINFSEAGEAGLITVNGNNSIVGLLNLVPRFWVSSNDTTAGYAEDKIIGVSGIIVTTINEGGNEQLQISTDVSAIAEAVAPLIEHNGLAGVQGGVSGEHYHLTAQELIDLTSGLSADNQHFHNASAIPVDDTCFDILSGTDLNDLMCQIDEQLKTINTILVNFDIAGSVRNGNTRLCLDNDVASVRFKHDKNGCAGFSARIPDGYVPGADLTARIKWYSLGGDANNVVWDLNYKDLNVGDDASAVSSTVQQVVAEPGTAYEVVETQFTIPASGIAVGDVIILTLKRRGDLGTDTSDELASLIELSLDY